MLKVLWESHFTSTPHPFPSFSFRLSAAVEWHSAVMSHHLELNSLCGTFCFFSIRKATYYPCLFICICLMVIFNRCCCKDCVRYCVWKHRAWGPAVPSAPWPSYFPGLLLYQQPPGLPQGHRAENIKPFARTAIWWPHKIVSEFLGTRVEDWVYKGYDIEMGGAVFLPICAERCWETVRHRRWLDMLIIFKELQSAI